MTSAARDDQPIPGSLIDEVCDRFARQKPIRQPLPGGGMLNIDRPLPFLCVHRRNPARVDRAAELFVNAEASFLNAPGDAPVRKGLRRLVGRLSATAGRLLGGYMIVEIWSDDPRQMPPRRDRDSGELLLPPPAFRIVTRRPPSPGGAVAALEFALQRIQVHHQPAETVIEQKARNHSPGMTQLLSQSAALRINCQVVGLAVRPIYLDPDSGEVYHKVLTTLRRGVTRALRKSFFNFSLNRTGYRPNNYYALGRTTLPQLVWRVDRQLAEVSGRFRFLLACTPVNAERSRREFLLGDERRTPLFQYRPLDHDPLLLKRRLLRISTERIEDPALEHVMRQTQDELDRQLTMLKDVGTPRFLPGSLQVFGGVEPSLLRLARRILDRLPAEESESSETETVGARSFARAAEKEFAYYRDRFGAFAAQAIVRDDMYSGLLSTGGNLLIGRETRIARHRIEALIQHEVGTHLVTYYNGQAQPLRLLKVGLAGYDELQEGLAVLSEYLVGGLGPARLRTLAARVVATDRLIRGDSFPRTYAHLARDRGFDPGAAYTITLRVYRGGGLTKDAVYLRGLVDILEYVAKGGELEPLMVGKIAADHVPIIRELTQRGVLRAAPLTPRYLEHPTARERLARLRGGGTVLDLIESPDSAPGTSSCESDSS